MDSNKYIQLLDKYRKNQCSKDELIELFDWINSEGSSADLDRHFTAQIDSPNTFEQELPMDDPKEILQEIKSKGRIKKSLVISFAEIRKYAAILIACLMVGGLSWYFIDNFTAKQNQLVFSIDKGHKGNLMLTDGSTVCLNSGSSITYSTDNKRNIKLEGEAYIHVTKDKKQPFVVHTSYLDVVVYGTTFNVTAYPGDPNISVSLMEGSVGIQLAGQNDITYISPGQTAHYNTLTKQLELLTEDLSEVALWRNEELLVKNATIASLCKKIESWYGVKITLVDQPVKNHLYNMSIRNESIEDVLTLMNEVSPIEYNIKGKEVTIKYLR